ncbi:uncharacterized protein LOC144920321 isoform X3 [Branchiostoma floridae x Branchiostoma belcheri]
MDETEGDGKEKKEAALVRAAEKGDTDRVKQLLAEGVNPNAAGRWQRTALYLAAGNGHHETVSALLTAGADVNTRDQKQRTPLHLAAVAEICYHETVSVLLTAGADVNARDDEQMTPLHWAAANGHQETVSALLTAGADVNARDKSQSCPLHWAAENGHHETVSALLTADADMNAKNKRQYSPLHLASENGDRDTVSALLAAGADVNAWDNCQSSPLHWAALNDKHETVSALLTAGADVKALDKWRNTPLHDAATLGHPKCAEILLQHGADTGIRNKEGRTANDIAADKDIRGGITENTKEEKERVTHGRKEVLELLQKQNNRVSEPEKGYDPVLVRYFEKGMTKAKKDCPLIQEAAKESGKTEEQVRTFIGNYRKSLGDKKRRQSTDDTVAGHSGFTGYHEDSGMLDEDIRNNDYERERVSQSQKEILKLPRQQNDGVSKRKKGHDPVLVRFYEDRGMTVAYKNSPLIEEAAKKSGKTAQQVRNFIANYRRSQAFGKRSLPTDDTAAGYSGFTGSHNSGMSEEPDESEEAMEEVLSEQEEPRTETLSRTHEAVEQYSDRNNPTDEGETSQVQQEDEAVVVRSKASQIQPKKSGKRKSSNSGPLVKRPKQAVAQPGPITIAEVTDNSIRISWTEAAGSKDSYRISISNTDGVTAPSASVNPGDPLEYTFTGLTAGTEYTISVVTVSDGANSVARIETQRTTVAQPGAINITEVTDNSIRTTWTAAAGAKDSYRISISNNDGVAGPSKSVNTGGPLEHTFTGLTAGTEYTISVVTVSDGANSVARTETQRTNAAKPGPINIAEVTENSISITWTEAAGTKDGYRISISPTDGATASGAPVNAGGPLEHTFTGLTAGTEYTISVVTVSVGVNSVARIKTQRTTVAQPGPITIAETTENSTRIIWTEAAGAKDSYDISISPDTGVTNPTESVNPGGPLEHTFTTLTAGTEYTISALTVSGGKCSDPTIKVQRTKFTSVLLVNHEYGTSYGGPSTTSREVAQFLKLHGATVHATALQASEEDKRCAEEDGVRLHLPFQKARKTKKPSLEWLTDYHSFHYPDIPTNIKCVVGHADVTSGAAKSIQENHCERAKLILFNHDMLEDTEYYKETKRAMAAGKMMEDILEDAKNADAVFSLGKRIYNYFETKYKSLGESKPSQHFLFLPRPSPVFEAISVSPGGGEKVVLSVGRVTEVDKLKGHDLVARAMGEVAEKITNIRLCVRGIDENDFEASKRILEENLHSGKIKPTLLPCGTQEDIAQDMRQAHLVLMPSRAEPFGLIGLEAIAAGIPVLISDKSGLADMIKDLIKEEKCSADMRHRIVKTSVRESDLEETAKRWAERIEDSLDYSTWEFKKAAEYKNELLESTYWEESHQNLLRACGLID